MKKYVSIVIVLISFFVKTSAQFSHSGRGMYVNKFFNTAQNTSGVLIPNQVNSILSFAAKEDSLLQYAKNNHITYLILYDLHRILGNATYEGYLCNFMQKAKTLYCIDKFGIASSCASMFDNVAVIAPSQPIDFNDSRFSNYNDDEKAQLSLAEQSLPPEDSLFLRSEMSKLVMLLTAFNDNCTYKFDVMVTEFEFWNPGVDDCTGQNLTKDQKYVNYQGMISDMDVIRDNYNSSHAHQIYVESYLGYFNQNTAYTHQTIANWIDGMTASGKRRVDRIILHYYGSNPFTLYSRTAAGQNYSAYYATRFLDLCQSSTNNLTNFAPIFSSEYLTWGAGASYLGPWFNQNVNNNIFTAEKAFYNDWYDDATIYSPSIVGSATQKNVVYPGNVVWFTSGQQVGHIDRPLLFTSNSPVCTASGQNGTFSFQYQGPIEQCSSYKFYITNANSSTLRCGSLSSYTWPAYNGSTHKSIDLDATIGACSLPAGNYDAHLELTYSNGCTPYSQVLRVSVVNSGQIVALTPTTACQGNPVFLQASIPASGTTTYAWYDGSTAISGATSSSYAPGAPTAGIHNYKCRITSSISACSANFSNIIPVTINAYPSATITGTTSAGCSAVLQANPASATYQWHNGSTSRNYTTSIAGTYSVAVTVSGCTSTASYTYSKVALLFSSKTNACSGGSTGSLTVNISSGIGPYSLSWSGNSSGNLTGLSAGNVTISNLSAGTYSVTVTDASGCTASLTPSQAIVSSAAITVNTSSTSATCPTSSNGSASITSVTGGNGGPYTYLWLYNNSTGGVLSNIPTGTYVVVVTDGTPCSVTKNITVSSVNPTVAPSISISSSAGTSICSGSAVIFTASPVNGGSSPVYQWKKNGVVVGTNSNTYSVSNLTNGNVISCELTSNALCASPSTATSNSITMTVSNNLTPSLTIVSSQGNSICSGVTVIFTATPSNAGSTPSYQWKKNGSNVGSNSSTYSSGSIVNSDVISCVLTTSAGCFTPPTATSNSITMTVNPIVTPSVSITSSLGTSICSGASVTFTAVPVNGGSTPVYQWKNNGVNTGTNSSTYTTVSISNNDVITCVLTSNVICPSTTTATSNAITMNVSTNLVPSITISANTGNSICSGANVIFSATPVNGGANPSYQWKLNGINVGTNSSTFSSSSINNNDVVGCTLTSNHSCVTSTNATSNILTMQVTALVTPSVSISSSQGNNICAGVSVTFSATPLNGGLAPFYQWKINGVNVGTNSNTYTTSSISNNDVITCDMSSGILCVTSGTVVSNSITMLVLQSVTPSIVISSGSGNSICDGAFVSFTAVESGGGSNPLYQWKKNGLNVGSNSPSYTDYTLVNNDVITCDLTSNDTCAITSLVMSNLIMMEVNPYVYPYISIVAYPGNSICSGTNVQFSAVSNNAGAQPIYQWKLNGLNVGSNSATYSNNSLSNSDVITCDMISNAPCVLQPSVSSGAITMNVTQTEVPAISISADPGNSICTGSPVQFTALVSNGGTSPILQWKVNGLPVGTNSTTFTTSSLGNNNVVMCSLNSNQVCAAPANVSSNSILMSVSNLVTPSVSVSSNVGNVICQGSPVIFTATPINGGSTPVYEWQKNGSVVGSNSSSYSSSSLSNNDVITCFLSSNAACATTGNVQGNSITMTVNPVLIPSVNISVTGGNNICSNSTVLFNASYLNGGVSPVFQWKINGINAGSNSSSFIGSGFSDNDIVSCVMTSNAGCASPMVVSGNDIVLSVTNAVLPSVSISSNITQPICPGTNVTFTATPVNGGASPDYQWMINGVNVGSNSDSYSNNSLTDYDTVSCEMTSSELCVLQLSCISNSINLLFNPAIVPSVTIISDHGSSFCVDDTVRFTAIPVNGGANPTYKWMKNGIIVGTNMNSYTSHGFVDGDTIICEITSSADCIAGNTAISNSIIVSIISCGLTIDLRLMIQGFYQGNGLMRPVVNSISYPWVCDTIIIALASSSPPYAELYSFKEVIDVNGSGVFYLPNVVLNANYYLVVKHRNSLDTWSSTPVFASLSISYDFSVSNSAAYGGNLADMGDGFFALWSGDVSDGSILGNQDGVVSFADLYSIGQAALNFNTGYTITDITGDGMTESADISLIENNVNMFISVSRP